MKSKAETIWGWLALTAFGVALVFLYPAIVSA